MQYNLMKKAGTDMAHAMMESSFTAANQLASSNLLVMAQEIWQCEIISSSLVFRTASAQFTTTDATADQV